MIDLASMTKLKILAVPSFSGSVYLDVSQRVIHGCVPSSSRRSHFTLAFPSHPGSNKRSGRPCSGRSGSPFCAQTTSPSSSAFSIGMLRVIKQASAPSARNQVALRCAPASRNKVATGTPVHSELLVMPSVRCGVMSGAGFTQAARPLPEHSTKYTRVTCGNRLMSSTLKLSGRSTRPWMTRRCAAGSIVGTPAWCLSKCRSDGVIVPVRVCNGVMELPTGFPTGLRPVGAANGDRTPTADVGVPMSRACVAPPGGTTAGAVGGAACLVCDEATVGTDVAMTEHPVPAIHLFASMREISIVNDYILRLFTCIYGIDNH